MDARRGLRWTLIVIGLAGCGARSSLATPNEGTGGGLPVPCIAGAVEPCGSDVGACKKGERKCEDGYFGACLGGVGPVDETCNGIDDNCDGQIDEGFHLGEPCDGPDTDLCLDDVMTCAGCSVGKNNVEICNGIDDNCNGIIDADCEVGDCQPTLLVTGSVASDPGCIDFPVMAGSTGVIEYPCGGGPVTATLGGIQFTGDVTNGFVSLDGVVIIKPPETPDGCVWQTSHHIEGEVSTGEMSYSYSEMVLSGDNCWSPCTETGTVSVQWIPGG